uniref:Uncharacterized protein n=1 Tax=Corethron hystrix TaxID=216773 RepID=A0A7S1BFG1_9STRA|mmetsp:Transcript_25986/g.59792  ORF Transcript_25986/g.59792 Transcript_25986/m.59792 type:complete len:189 (+) Transcript_25986:348-914(+)|eukprot:CAMPEP_0113302242 /NCGR_PEP_ID=MMETSP0010_2-20120614/3135_1 /TAXON_ID=216773 ORGANISM="Corethron hystrix, Strain 308" /NCGR_SAMPLE_ID=MMETSP0010_2 /ASSEMBLY_ACC=CAM_ASM_000155 /LENGTH=188 /DNA_ID=CAMNT_0000155997 /DNA_START=234 /DNA_END=800 /DNA_ORIENTATION=+ /assembly_acc=CAM_ASM_000155
MLAQLTFRVAVAAIFVATSTSFTPTSLHPTFTGKSIHASRNTQLSAKGFGEKKVVVERQKSAGQIKREEEGSRYDEISSGGGQEYNIFVRKFGGDDTSWFPCGSIAVPRGAQVSDAIYSNVSDLKSAIVRTYPKLKGEEDDFEFGYNLKVYPDDPVEVAMKSGLKSSGPSIGNWISNVFSPVDTSSQQ